MRRLALILLLSAARAWGSDSGQGHSHPAGNPEELGKVSFNTSCSPAAQVEFERTLTMLHSFWYEASEGAFLEVLRADPTCAIAYWGVAMSLWHPLWTPPDEGALRRGLDAVERARAIGAKSPRERGFIEAIAAYYDARGARDPQSRALAYEAAMADLQARFPDDPEAKVFYALALLATAPPTDKTYAHQLKAAAILEPIFKDQPGHPGA